MAFERVSQTAGTGSLTDLVVTDLEGNVLLELTVQGKADGIALTAHSDDESASYAAELSVTGEAMCTVRLADLQTAVSVLEAINPFEHRESERWLDRLKDEL